MSESQKEKAHHEAGTDIANRTCITVVPTRTSCLDLERQLDELILLTMASGRGTLEGVIPIQRNDSSNRSFYNTLAAISAKMKITGQLLIEDE